MAMELFLGSIAVLSLVAAIVMMTTTTKRVDYSFDRSRRDSQRGERAKPD